MVYRRNLKTNTNYVKANRNVQSRITDTRMHNEKPSLIPYHHCGSILKNSSHNTVNKRSMINQSNLTNRAILNRTVTINSTATNKNMNIISNQARTSSNLFGVVNDISSINQPLTSTGVNDTKTFASLMSVKVEAPDQIESDQNHTSSPLLKLFECSHPFHMASCSTMTNQRNKTTVTSSNQISKQAESSNAVSNMTTEHIEMFERCMTQFATDFARKFAKEFVNNFFKCVMINNNNNNTSTNNDSNSPSVDKTKSQTVTSTPYSLLSTTSSGSSTSISNNTKSSVNASCNSRNWLID